MSARRRGSPLELLQVFGEGAEEVSRHAAAPVKEGGGGRITLLNGAARAPCSRAHTAGSGGGGSGSGTFITKSKLLVPRSAVGAGRRGGATDVLEDKKEDLKVLASDALADSLRSHPDNCSQVGRLSPNIEGLGQEWGNKEEWGNLADLDPETAKIMSRLNLNLGQLKDIINYAFANFDVDGDGRISEEEFALATGMLGLKMTQKESRQIFMMLSHGREAIGEEVMNQADLETWSSALAVSFKENVARKGFAKAEYVFRNVEKTLQQEHIPLPDRVEQGWAVLCKQAFYLEDMGELLIDAVGTIVCLVAIADQIKCLPNGCTEDNLDLNNLIPLVIFLFKTARSAIKEVRNVNARDLDREYAMVFAQVFKPAGFSVPRFERMQSQVESVFERLPSGLRITQETLDAKLLLIVRGAVKICRQGNMPGLVDTLAALRLGSFLGAAEFMGMGLTGGEACWGTQGGEYVEVGEETVVLVWDSQKLKEYLRMHGNTQRLLLGMLCKSIAETMTQEKHMSRTQAGELPLFFEDFIQRLRGRFDADRVSVWVHNAANETLWTLFISEDGAETFVAIPSSTGLAGVAFTSGRRLNIEDCYADERFNTDLDKKGNYYTKSMLCIPVEDDSDDLSERGKLIGVLQVINKRDHSGKGDRGWTIFTEQDERLADDSTWLICMMIRQLRKRYNSPGR